MQPLAEPALAAYRNGEIRLVPERWGATYEHWMENIRDWNISRQLWWGHRIPVFNCAKCAHQWADREDPKACPKDRKSTRLNSSHGYISYAVFCLKKKKRSNT